MRQRDVAVAASDQDNTDLSGVISITGRIGTLVADLGETAQRAPPPLRRIPSDYCTSMLPNKDEDNPVQGPVGTRTESATRRTR
jgi:hypothetical protein